MSLNDIENFKKEAKQTRREFAAVAAQYTVDEHLKLRTEIDSILIMYDQILDRLVHPEKY